MKKIVEYDSQMNTISFGKFKEKELDLFFSICYKMKNEGINEVVLSFQELKELSKYSRNDLKRFVKDLESTYTKLLDIKFEILISPKIREKFVLFTRYRIDEERKEMTIQLHKEYNFVLNDIGKFTKFDLIEFVSLKSSYAKNMFKILKQFDTINKESWYQIKLDDFKVLLDIPKSYQMINIDKRVLLPILEQLKPLFQGLEIEKIKKGVKVDSLKFTWKNRKEKKSDIIEIQPVKRKKATLGEKELQEHEKNQLENTIQELEKKKIVKESSLDPVVGLKKISKIDYDNLYDEYLEKLGEEHNLYIR
ncbi:MAG: replication initiation protein, partial [Clostridium sp.]